MVTPETKKILNSTTERVEDRKATIKFLAEKFADSMNYSGEKRERAIQAYISDCNKVSF